MEREEIVKLLGELSSHIQDQARRIGETSDIDKLKILALGLQLDKRALDIYIEILESKG